MATLDDILTTHKNGVVAINNLGQVLKSFYRSFVYMNGDVTSNGLSASSMVATASGRLVRMVVLTAGSTVGKIYDYVTYPTLTTGGDGATVTITFSGTESFTAGDVVVIRGVQPSGYNGTYIATGGGVGSVQFASAVTGAQTAPGTVFKASVANAICSIPNTAGVHEIGAQFSSGLYVSLGTGQEVSVTYSLD